MLLVYTHKITPRLTYVFKQICTHILGVEVGFTSKVEDFIAHKSLKMSYTLKPLSNELFIKSHGLLFEQGLSDIELNVKSWNDTKGFFTTGERSSLPFDIFAASFFLLSRYEEYLPHVRDEYGRFMLTESVAHQHRFLHQPVVDIWAYKLRKVLQERFPDFKFPERSYKIKPVIDVPMAYYYKRKGFLRTIGGALSDLGRFNFSKSFQRFKVLLGFEKDPYDTFDWIINCQKTSSTKFLVFFLVGDYSTYDKNISINKKGFVSLIKSVADYCTVGLKSSYFALEDLKTLKMEKKRLELILNSGFHAVRHSFSKLNLPDSYRHLNELEIKEDYTMGYVNALGFRAGTCTPFLFYDLDFEMVTPLKIHPYHFMDFALLKHKSELDKQEHLNKIITEIKNVNGTFIPVFHNYAFSDFERWKGFKTLFQFTLDSAK